MTANSSSSGDNSDRRCDVLIRGGLVIDGSRAPRRRADVAIAQGRVLALGNLAGWSADDVIDATGLVVAPGFIDCHTHDDAAVLLDPELMAKISQGVTTVVTGNCGISLAPLTAGTAVPMPLGLLTGDDPGAHMRFAGMAAYLAALEAAPASVNVAALVGHTSLRIAAMADLAREASDDEIAVMAAGLREALDAGAFGISTGTYYPPAAAATMRELIGVMEPLKGRGAVFATHMRDEADHVLASLEESFAIGRAVDARVIISHHKLQREANFGRSAETLPVIARAMTHQCAGLDCYPYAASSTMLHLDEARLQGRVVIASSGSHPELVGEELAAVAARWGVSRAEAAARLQPASAVYFSMDEADVRAILAFEPTMIGSDGLPGAPAPHPRLWGTFPRVLGHYAREVGLFDLETAIWKMTGLPADNFGITSRGRLAPGRAADVVVLDAAAVIDRATYACPTHKAEGIIAVLVNGVMTYAQGRHTGARCGQVLRKERA
jgi:N-acyl-D-amino-acid deacylase